MSSLHQLETGLLRAAPTKTPAEAALVGETGSGGDAPPVPYASRRYAYQRVVDPIQLRVIDALAHRTSPRSVLDIGSARCKLLQSMAEGADFRLGLDINKFALRHRPDDVSGVAADASLDLPLADAAFDLVVSTHVIEHMEDPRRFLQEIDRICRPGGYVVLAYPAEPVRGAYALWSSVSLYGNPFHVREIHKHRLNPRRLARLCSGSELEIVWTRLAPVPCPQHITVLRRRQDTT